MRTRLVLAAGIAALIAGLVAAFGRGTSAAAPPLGGGASVAPANAAAFLALDSDLGSSQWQAVDALLTKLGVLSQLQDGLQKQTGLSWDGLKTALGPETDVVVLAGGGKPQAVLLTQPSDSAKLQALLQKGGSRAVTAQVDGWTVVSDSRAALDAVTGATAHLSTDASYLEASGHLVDGAFARVYANGAEAQKLASSFGAQATQAQVAWAAGDVVASDGGLRLDGFVRGGRAAAQPYTATLADTIPSGVLLAADFQGDQLKALGTLGDALSGESALYVTPGQPFPAITLVTQASDPQAVLDAIHQALANAGALGSFLQGVTLSHEQVGSDLVVSTSQAAIDAFKSGGPKLPGDATFQEAQSAAGMPAQTTGFVYANLKDALPYVQGLLKTSTSGADLSALHSLLAYGTGSSGGVARFAAFLTVR